MFLSNNEMVDVNQTLAVPDEDKGITTELLKSVFATRWMVTGEEGSGEGREGEDDHWYQWDKEVGVRRNKEEE